MDIGRSRIFSTVILCQCLNVFRNNKSSHNRHCVYRGCPRTSIEYLYLYSLLPNSCVSLKCITSGIIVFRRISEQAHLNQVAHSATDRLYPSKGFIIVYTICVRFHGAAIETAHQAGSLTLPGGILMFTFQCILCLDLIFQLPMVGFETQE